MPETSASTFITVKARFTSPPEASKACATLNGLEAFGSTITARLSLEDWSGAGVIHDTSVRITWEAPTRPAFLGYHTWIVQMLQCPYNTALPAVARYNLRFDGVPADTDRQALKEFAKADDIVWGPINYTDGRYALNRLRTVVKGDNPDSVQFEFDASAIQSGYHGGSRAKALCDRLHNRKPKYLGLTRITARHEQTLEYSISPERYLKARNDLEDPTQGEDAQQLRHLKAQLDVALFRRSDCRRKGRRRLNGTHFSRALLVHPSVNIRVDIVKRRIRLFGPTAVRDVVRRQILDKLNELRSKTVYELESTAGLFGLFMNDELPELSRSVGQHNVFLNLSQRKLSIRGDLGVKDQAYEALTRAKRTYLSASDRPRKLVECPVCFNDVVTPITLCCGPPGAKPALFGTL
ncbi:hypothetical protein BKA70DRAFT_1221746 [Coprinopsis sp. MPI-PUGE-AT-0042]|nr:hypothetical protein BKA70DRAFT_1221746 [Coprinopsis sp. MPI-PUGE-AT-0042]